MVILPSVCGDILLSFSGDTLPSICGDTMLSFGGDTLPSVW